MRNRRDTERVKPGRPAVLAGASAVHDLLLTLTRDAIKGVAFIGIRQ